MAKRVAMRKRTRGYGEALYQAIEAAGGAYCATCHCYQGAGHVSGGSACDRLWAFRDPDGNIRPGRPGKVELIGPVFLEEAA